MSEYEDNGVIQVRCLALRPSVENLRCIELATGQVVYEFWVDGSQSMRFDAGTLEYALKRAREMVQQERLA